EMEAGLDKITQGQAQPRALLQQAWDSLQKGLGGMPAGADSITAPCPIDGCGGTVRRLESKKKPGTFFWACSNRDKHGLIQDADGKPGGLFEDKPQADSLGDGPLCKKCKVPTGKFQTKNGYDYYRCSKCKGAWWPDKEDTGKMGAKWTKQKG
ncbi:DNA topoisomerase I, partial [Acidithiobacillus sp. MC6.1]|nr:DNA topoisomerase I [Acidithiobacillus sp. MC6.1]